MSETIGRVIKGVTFFVIVNGGELHQVWRVATTGCTVGLLPIRFVALCFSHLVALTSSPAILNKEGTGLLSVSIQHGVLAFLTLYPRNQHRYHSNSDHEFRTATVAFLSIVAYVLLGVALRQCRSLTNMLYNLTPIYTTLIKVYQLYCNLSNGHTGMTSQLSTLHILLLSIYFLSRLDRPEPKIRTILIVCLLTNSLQLGQCLYFQTRTASVLYKECGIV